MKIVHWVMKNGSGMHRMAEDMARGEKSLGLESLCLDCFDTGDLVKCLDADIHVVHTHLPEMISESGIKIVWVAHGTPEHCFQHSVITGTGHHHGSPDTWMMVMHHLQRSDAVVTFWPRHQLIWKSISDKGKLVECVPMGIDTSFWQQVQSRGRFAGTPSLLTAENGWYIKWPLDLFIAFPWTAEDVPTARLHVFYLSIEQGRWWFSLINRNGAAYRSYVVQAALSHDDLRNAFASVDYYIGLVRYGDFNRICLEAKACGCRTISYAGNPYADFWLPEGDQREIARGLTSILKGEAEARSTPAVPTLEDMARAMINVYERI